ncbi:MAG: pyridoxal phosphate-dependent aminotransferase [Patescibacteria group bacterium]
MRGNIVHASAGELSYEIREIVDFGLELEREGIKLVWENIGDPVAKGETIPDWIKEIIMEAIKENSTFAYSPTKGLLETRKFLSTLRTKEGGEKLEADDILFFNGLGDAVSKVYTYLNKNARVLGPSPAYPTHSSAEAAHAESHHLTYQLNPYRNWLPDIEDLRNKIRYNEAISGILIINPDNPTGMIYPERVLKEIVSIAKEFDLFLISDEIYSNIYYGPEKFVSLSQVLDGVPAIVMKGLSKEIPWPGARCGWIEVYNKDKDESFARYIKTINDAKMLEVCATTLPQKVLPKIFSDPRYEEHLKNRRDAYKERAETACKILGEIKGISVVKPSGAFYLTVVFDQDAISGDKTIPIKSEKIKSLIEKKVATLKEGELDKRFVYYLMGGAHICVVPLSGFNTNLYGFRMTLLEENKEKFEKILKDLGEAIEKYLSS